MLWSPWKLADLIFGYCAQPWGNHERITCPFPLTRLIGHAHENFSFITSEGFVHSHQRWPLRCSVQSLVTSRQDYCNSLLAGLPLNTIRFLIQNAAAQLIFNLPKLSHHPMAPFPHWTPVAAHIRFETLMLAYNAKNRPAPAYLKTPSDPLAPINWSHHLPWIKTLHCN